MPPPPRSISILLLLTFFLSLHALRDPHSGLRYTLHGKLKETLCERVRCASPPSSSPPPSTTADDTFAHFIHTQTHLTLDAYASKDFSTIQHSQKTPAVSVVVLSPKTRALPSWLWLAASAGWGTMVVTRRGGAMHGFTADFPVDYLQALEYDGKIRLVRADGNLGIVEELGRKLGLNLGRKPFEEAEFLHFVLQLLDHVVAWEACEKIPDGEYCLVLEDDVVLAKNWRVRLSQAIEKAHRERPTWGILKLFEIDGETAVWGWELEFLPFMFSFGGLMGFSLNVLWWVLGNFISPPAFPTNPFVRPLPSTIPSVRMAVGSLFGLTVVWFAYASYFLLDDTRQRYEPTLNYQHVPIIIVFGPLAFFVYVLQANQTIRVVQARSALFVTAWSILMTAMMGQWFFYPNPLLRTYTRYDQVTTVRDATSPIRGAVANVYRAQDLPGMIQSARASVSNMNINIQNLNLAALEPYRADVYAARYFLNLNRPVLIAEPNTAQHFGFISSAPGNQFLLAMSSTFDDGSVF